MICLDVVIGGVQIGIQLSLIVVFYALCSGLRIPNLGIKKKGQGGVCISFPIEVEEASQKEVVSMCWSVLCVGSCEPLPP